MRMPAKQVIVMRKDLNMRKGKMVAQGSHASMAVLIRKWRSYVEAVEEMQQLYREQENFELGAVLMHQPVRLTLTQAEQEWYFGNFRKICCYVENEAALLDVHQRAIAAGLTSHLIEDHGLTEFNGVLTKTCIAIGPHLDEEIDPITKDLPLL